MITQHTVRSIISPPIRVLKQNGENKSGENHAEIDSAHQGSHPLSFAYYRDIIVKLYSSSPTKPKN